MKTEGEENMSRMKEMGVVVALVLLATMSSICAADVPGMTFSHFDTIAGPGNYTMGFQFTVGGSDLSVTSLGYFNQAGWTSGTRDVGMFDSAGNLLFSTSVAFDAAQSGDHYTFQTIAPETLTAGETYTVAGVLNSDNWGQWGFDLVAAPGLVSGSVGGRYGVGPGLTVPQYIGATNGDGSCWSYLNANFQYTATPEPATMALLAIGGIGALLRRRE